MVTNVALPDDIFNALGHATRRQILLLLRDGPCPVGVIADRLPVTRPAVSKHLRSLREAGLVVFESQGTRNMFRLEESGFVAARSHLEGFWAAALQNFERLVAADGNDG